MIVGMQRFSTLGDVNNKRGATIGHEVRLTSRVTSDGSGPWFGNDLLFSSSYFLIFFVFVFLEED